MSFALFSGVIGRREFVHGEDYYVRLLAEDGTVLTPPQKAVVETNISALKARGLTTKFSSFYYYDFARNTTTSANLLPIFGIGNFVLSANAVTSGVRDAYGLNLPGNNDEYATGPIIMPEAGAYAFFVRYKYKDLGSTQKIINFSEGVADEVNNQNDLRCNTGLGPGTYHYSSNLAVQGRNKADGEDIVVGVVYDKVQMRLSSREGGVFDLDQTIGADDRHNHTYAGGQTWIGGEKSTNLEELDIQSIIVVGFTPGVNDLTNDDFFDIQSILGDTANAPLMTPAEAVTDFVDRMLADVGIVVPAEGQTLALEMFTELSTLYETPGDSATASMLSKIKNMPAMSTMFGLAATGAGRQTVDMLGEGVVYDIPDGTTLTKNGFFGRDGLADSIRPAAGNGIIFPGNSVIAIGESPHADQIFYQSGVNSTRRFFFNSTNTWQRNEERLGQELVYIGIAPKPDEFGGETTNHHATGRSSHSNASGTWSEGSTSAMGTGDELSIDPYYPTYIGGNDAAGLTSGNRVRDFIVLDDWAWADEHKEFFGGKLTTPNVLPSSNWNIACKTKWIHPVLILGDSHHDEEDTDWAALMMRNVMDRIEGLMWWNTARGGSRLEQMFTTPPEISTAYLFETIAGYCRDNGFSQSGVAPIVINLHAYNDFAGQTGTLQDEYDKYIRYCNNMRDIALTGSTTIVDDGNRVVDIGAPMSANTLFIQGSGQPNRSTSGGGVTVQSDLWDGAEDFATDPAAALAASNANDTESRHVKANRKLVAEPEGWMEGVIDIFDELIWGNGHPAAEHWLHYSLDSANTSDDIHLNDAANIVVAEAAETQLRAILDLISASGLTYGADHLVFGVGNNLKF